jgi:sec-independent protein translocase protein TatC
MKSMIWHSFFYEVKARILYIFLSFLLTLSIVLSFQAEYFYLWISPFSVFELTKPRAFLCMDLTEPMTIQLWVYLISTSIFVTPFCSFQVFAFLSPSFYKNDWEKLASGLFRFFSSLYFCWAFSYMILFPKICLFFFQFEQKESFIPIILEPRITSFFVFFLNTLSLQFFFLVGVLFLIKLIRAKTIKLAKYRRIFAFLALFLAAWLSPPDILSQMFIMSIFFIFYEILVIYAFFISQKCSYEYSKK